MPRTPTTTKNQKQKNTDPDLQIIQVNFRLDAELRDRIQEYCAETGVPQSEVLRRAVIEYLDERMGDPRLAKIKARAK